MGYTLLTIDTPVYMPVERITDCNFKEISYDSASIDVNKEYMYAFNIFANKQIEILLGT